MKRYITIDGKLKSTMDYPEDVPESAILKSLQNGDKLHLGEPPEDIEIYEHPRSKKNSPRMKRMWEYPAIAEQLDMLYHDMDQGLIAKSPTWFSAIKAIKDKHPKE